MQLFAFAGILIYETEVLKRAVEKVQSVVVIDNVHAPEDLPYATDDEPFLHLVNKTYNDEDLHEWEPATYNGTRPGDPGHLGEIIKITSFGEMHERKVKSSF